MLLHWCRIFLQLCRRYLLWTRSSLGPSLSPRRGRISRIHWITSFCCGFQWHVLLPGLNARTRRLSLSPNANPTGLYDHLNTWDKDKFDCSSQRYSWTAVMTTLGLKRILTICVAAYSRFMSSKREQMSLIKMLFVSFSLELDSTWWVPNAACNLATWVALNFEHIYVASRLSQDRSQLNRYWTKVAKE